MPAIIFKIKGGGTGCTGIHCCYTISIEIYLETPFNSGHDIFLQIKVTTASHRDIYHIGVTMYAAGDVFTGKLIQQITITIYNK